MTMSLHGIDLSENCLGDESVQVICNGIVNSSSLSWLAIQGNPFAYTPQNGTKLGQG